MGPGVFGVCAPRGEREFFIDNLLVRIHYIILVIRWTGLAPWESEFPFPGSLECTYLAPREEQLLGFRVQYLGWEFGSGD